MSNLRRKRADERRKAELKIERASLQEALELIDSLERELMGVKRLARVTKRAVIKPHMGKNTSEATAIAMLSDVHIGQHIDRGQVNDLNEYNLKIARVRVKTFFERIVRLTNKERQDVHIEELILFLGGDIIEGDLHLDTIMASDVKGALNQVVEAQILIEGGIQYLIDNGGFKNITVVCADGNHGRVSKKQHFHSRRGNALEYYLYYNLAQRFPNLKWVIEEGLLTYVPVYNSVLRFMHGDRIAFGGINGFYTYLQRRIFEWDTSTRADHTFLGHLHQYTPSGGGRRYTVNGSVVGYNPFAIALGAKYEPPTQAYLLWDKKRGASVQMPILFDI